jgi:hypothetical protein
LHTKRHTDLDVVRIIAEDVLRLQVAVDDFVEVQLVERKQQLDQDLRHPLRKKKKRMKEKKKKRERKTEREREKERKKEREKKKERERKKREREKKKRERERKRGS